MAFATLQFEVRTRRDLPKALVRKMSQRELPDFLRDAAEQTKDYAIDLAHERIVTDRPQERRRWDAPHYVDSFETTRFEVSGERARLTVVNTHPYAKGIENGTPAHTIEPRGTHGAFSLDTLRGGDYTSTQPPFMVYGPFFGKTHIDHPDVEGTHICRDAANWAQQRFSMALQLRLVPAR